MHIYKWAGCRLSGDIMAIVSLLFKVASHASVSYQPHRDMKVTAIVAKGNSFRVRVSDRSGATITGDALIDGANLSTTIYINPYTSLVFQNNSGTERTGFVCAEEV
jgi:hypothetical protein